MSNNYIIYRYLSPSNKSYIGQTCQSLNARSGSKGQQYYASTKFYNAIQKYGWDWFKNHREILAKDLTAEQADKLEAYYINKFNSIKNGYNIQKGGHFNPADFCCKKVVGINCETKELIFFDSITSAAKSLNIDRRCINKVVNHEKNHHTAGGYVWYSQDEWNNMSDSKKDMAYQIKPKIKNKERKVICLNTGIIYSSLKEATQKTGINNISKCCRHITKSAGKIDNKKAVWRYYDEYLEEVGSCL